MLVFYKLRQEKRQTSKNKGKWYARAVVTEMVDITMLANIMQQNCTVKKSDILAVIAELVEVMKQQLQDSKNVRLDGFGTFRIGFHIPLNTYLRLNARPFMKLPSPIIYR